MANLICAKCGQPIEKDNLIECPFCWEIYHKECWEETKNCLSCKKFNLDFARVQAEKEAEEQRLAEELKAKNVEEKSEDNNEAEDEELEYQTPTREMNHSAVANNVMTISKIILIIAAVSAVALVALMVYYKGVLIGGIIGGVGGAILVAIGWAVSVLINGFSELINNTQKNGFYLSKLLEQKDNNEKGNDE